MKTASLLLLCVCAGCGEKPRATSDAAVNLWVTGAVIRIEGFNCHVVSDGTNIVISSQPISLNVPVPSTKATTTYTVKTPVWETKNAIEVLRDHEPNCTLVRYVEGGGTNEFHAWMVPVVVVTNTP